MPPAQNAMRKNKSSVRNVQRVATTRINDDWQYLAEEELSTHPTTDQVFNRSYKNQGLGARKISRTNPDESTYYEDPQTEEKRDRRSLSLVKNIDNALTKAEGNKFLSKGLDQIHKKKTLAVNRSILTWSGYLWLFVQLPFAVLSTVMLAAMGAISSLGETVSESNFVVKFMASLLQKTASALEKLAGFSLTDVAAALFFLTYIVAFVVGMLILLATYLEHNLVANHPLGGRGAGFKLGALLIAIIGYSVPILNFLPWVLLWLFAIGKYPR